MALKLDPKTGLLVDKKTLGTTTLKTGLGGFRGANVNLNLGGTTKGVPFSLTGKPTLSSGEALELAREQIAAETLTTASDITSGAETRTGKSNIRIVNLLKNAGIEDVPGEKFPLFDFRKGLFGQLGLEDKLGEFRGSAEQNAALFNVISGTAQRAGVGVTQSNLQSIISMAREGTPATDTLQTTPGGVPTGAEIPESIRGLAEAALGFGAEAPSSEDIANAAIQQFTGTTSFALQQEATGAQKEAIKLGAERDTQQFIREIASRGLFFSGARKAGVSSIETNKLADLLGIDRKFAKIIATGLEASAQTLAKEAQKELKTGRTEATKALGELGFIVTPDGSIVQKPAEARAAATAARQERGEVRADIRLQLSAESAIRAQQAANKPLSRIFTDDQGTVTEILSDPFTGQELARINRGQIGKADPFLDIWIQQLLGETIGEFGIDFGEELTTPSP